MVTLLVLLLVLLPPREAGGNGACAAGETSCPAAVSVGSAHGGRDEQDGGHPGAAASAATGTTADGAAAAAAAAPVVAGTSAATLKLLWPAAVYLADLSDEMGTPAAPRHNGRLADLIADGFRRSEAVRPPSTSSRKANDHFYLWQRGSAVRGVPKDHFVTARQSAEDACFGDRGPRRPAAAECAEAAALAGGWPAFHNSEAFRRLFAWDDGLVWLHARRFVQALGLTDEPSYGGGPLFGQGERRRPPTCYVWANFHHNTSWHAEHDHMGAVVSGIYYVDVDPAGASALRLKDPRRRGLFDDAFRTSSDDEEEGVEDTPRPHGRRRGPPRIPGHHHDVTPRTGLLVLYPSWVPHEVLAMPPVADGPAGEEGAGPRISLAFNILHPGSMAIEPEGAADVVVGEGGGGDGAVATLPRVEMRSQWREGCPFAAGC